MQTMWLSVVVAVFILTQLAYALVNVAMAGLLYPRPVNEVTDEVFDAIETDRDVPNRVDDGERPEMHADGGTSPVESTAADDRSEAETRGCRLPDELIRQVHVLVPIFGERPNVLEETIEGIYEQTYPAASISVHVVYESDDETSPAALTCVSALRDRGYDVSALAVDRDALATDRGADQWIFTDIAVPRTKAAALTYAFMSLSLEVDDVVTVFDADTHVPADLFELAIAGLETYDIVQAKQTVRNRSDGILPSLEATGIAAWSDLLYAKTSRGPYQLLGKAYFTEARVIEALDEWQLEATTEDMALGMAAARHGYTLGVIDRYVQDLCPSDSVDWVRQKRRWVRGPYAYLTASWMSAVDRLRFWTCTIGTQLLCVANLCGLPAGVVVAVGVVTGSGPSIPTAVWPLVAINTVGWAYYSIETYRAAWAGIDYENRWDRLRHSLGSNPVTQALYATAWVVPITLAVLDVVRGRRPTFVVTPKR